MRERAEELGGNLAVETSPGGGTVIRAGLPLPEEG
jgi:signal transduction histidine kinase